MIDETKTKAQLIEELHELRQRVVELEGDNGQDQAGGSQRISGDQARLLLEWLPDPVVLYDMNGHVLYFNRAFAQTFGWSLDELLGKRVDFVPEENLPETRQAIVQVLGTLKPTMFESRRRTKDGRVLDAQIHGSALLNPDGSSAGLVVALRDISERKQAEQQLRTFEALAENAPDGIVVAGLDGSISYANPSFRALLGYDDALIGMPIDDCFAPEEPVRLDEINRHVSEHGAWQGIIACRRRDGGSFKAQTSIFAIYGRDGRPQAFPGIIRDLSAQLRAEEERLALQEQVIAAQQAALRELSTPLIPLAEGLVAMPLVGSIDSTRAQQIIETLLEGVSVNHADMVIVDITGVPLVDTQVANALIRAAQAVQLLGARVILTGIRPEVAQTLVGIGLSLGNIVTRSTLQSGISYALGRDRL